MLSWKKEIPKMDICGNAKSKPIVAVMYIGTYSSQCAFSSLAKKDEVLQLNDEYCGGFPTCMLFNKDKEFVAFGIEAKDKYEHADDATQKDLYFFNKFKLNLFNSIVSGDLAIKDTNGKTMSSEYVITAFIKHFLDTLLKQIEDQYKRHNEHSCFKADDVGVVFVVPDDIRNPCKTTIIKAARSAGVPDSNFNLVGEIEVVCIWCHNMHGNILTSGRCNIPCQTMTDMLIVNTGYERDLDNETKRCTRRAVDLTINIIRSDYDSENISQTTSWKFGSCQVDKVFEDFMSEVVDSDVLDEFKHEYSDEYRSMLHAFYLKLVNILKCDDFNLRLPMEILKLFEKKRGLSLEKTLDTSHDKKLRFGLLTVIGKAAENLKNEAIETIIEACKQVLTETLLYDVPTLVLYGHLAESSYLQMRVRELFSDKRIIIFDGGRDHNVIESGALFYGHSLSLPKRAVRKHKLLSEK